MNQETGQLQIICYNTIETRVLNGCAVMNDDIDVTQAPGWSKALPTRFKRYGLPLIIFLLAFVVYAASSYSRFWKPSQHTHFVDLARWGLGVDYPSRVSSSGGRYHYNDDQETPDTQVITMDFNNDTSMVWEGRSCNGYPTEDKAVGVIFHGDNGTLTIAENSYKIFDLANNLVKDVKNITAVDANSGDRVNPSPGGDILHIQNFFDAIRGKAGLNCPGEVGYATAVAVLAVNEAVRTNRRISFKKEAFVV